MPHHIEKLDIDLFPESTSENEYNKKKLKYIAEYETYNPGGFLRIGSYEKNPAAGEAKWNNLYPNGFNSWRENQQKLTAYGEQEVIDKINEIIDFLNTLPAHKGEPYETPKN